jgi:hypothetical protein
LAARMEATCRKAGGYPDNDLDTIAGNQPHTTLEPVSKKDGYHVVEPAAVDLGALWRCRLAINHQKTEAPYSAGPSSPVIVPGLPFAFNPHSHIVNTDSNVYERAHQLIKRRC